MKAEIIAVGNEIVFGHTINTNAAFLAQQLHETGILPQYHTAVCDDKEMLQDTLKIAQHRADVIILTGGLGPTPDDLTKETVCEFLNMPLEENASELERIKERFEKTGLRMPHNNEKQAAFPKEAVILPNAHGTASGCLMEKDRKTYILLPGPPEELKPMFLESVLPLLKAKSKQYASHLDIRCFGIGESALAAKLQDVIGEHEWGSIATYIDQYEVIVRITVSGNDEKKMQEELLKQKDSLEDRLKSFIVGYNNESLEENIAKIMLQRHLHAATVESCTGGLVAATLINCSGISECFNEGIVTYSNEAKMKYVGVKGETLDKVGAVSEETAYEMAEGIRRASGAEIGLSTTGIAGPGGGTESKPVGLVYIGISMQQGTEVYRLQLNGSRREVREKTVKNILFHLYQKLKEK